MPTFVAKCSPSLGRVSIWWARLSETLFWPSGLGKTIYYMQDKQGGEIAEARNAIVCEVLNYHKTCNPVSDLFWLDDDVLPMPGAVCELYQARKRYGVDIVSGTYFLKMDGPMCEPLLWPGEFGEGTLCPFLPDRAIPIKYCGMGLTLVRREVYEQLADIVPKDRYGRPQWYRTSTDEDIASDETGCVDAGYTEDVWFCRQAHRIGAKMLGMTTKHSFGFHTATQYECSCGFATMDAAVMKLHRNTFPDHRQTEGTVGFPQKQWRQWIQAQPIVWDTPEGPVVWD